MMPPVHKKKHVIGTVNIKISLETVYTQIKCNNIVGFQKKKKNVAFSIVNAIH
jgi:hypothetical protein